MALKRDLSFFDLTNIVVGAIIGSDIYIASALTARLIGPFSIIVWIIAGIIATILAMIFAYSAYYVPEVGGRSPLSRPRLTSSGASLQAGACGSRRSSPYQYSL